MQKLEENVDYELVPSDDDAWHIRILEGDYTESVIQFGAIQVTEDEENLSFNFELVSSPDPDLTEENTGLQEYVGGLLLSIIETSLEKSEQNDNEH